MGDHFEVGEGARASVADVDADMAELGGVECVGEGGGVEVEGGHGGVDVELEDAVGRGLVGGGEGAGGLGVEVEEGWAG